MKPDALIGPVLAGGVACLAGLWFADAAHPPDLFPYSSVAAPAALTALLALGLSLMLPDRLFMTKAERILSDLSKARGLTRETSARVAALIGEARQLAESLRAASPGLREDAARLAIAGAEDLEDLAERMIADPAFASTNSGLVSRSSMVIEAVDAFVALKADIGADEDEVDAARAKIMESLKRLSEAADAAHGREARRQVLDIEVATEVADDLLRRNL